jgi:hypothetical protein
MTTIRGRHGAGGRAGTAERRPGRCAKRSAWPSSRPACWCWPSQFWQFVRADPVVWSALLGGSVAALATALGTLPVLFSQKLPDRLQDTLFGFGAGVMLAASAFSLIIPGLEAARQRGRLRRRPLGGGRRDRLGHPAGRRRAHG